MSGLAVVSPTAFHLSARSETERVEGELVSGNYFEVLGVTAARGRLITSADDESNGADQVAVLSFRLWQRRFGGDAGAIGSTDQARRTRLHHHRRGERAVRGHQDRRASGHLGADSDPAANRSKDDRAVRSAPRVMARDVRAAEARRDVRAGADPVRRDCRTPGTGVPRHQRPCRRRNGRQGWAGIPTCERSCGVSRICHLPPSGSCWSLPAPMWPGCCWRVPPAVNGKSRPGSRSAPDGFA